MNKIPQYRYYIKEEWVEENPRLLYRYLGREQYGMCTQNYVDNWISACIPQWMILNDTEPNYIRISAREARLLFPLAFKKTR